MRGGIPTERQVQREILRMLGICFPRAFAFHIPNGAHLAGNQTARFKQIGALKGDGLKIGMADLGVLWPVGKGCWIEVKRPKLGKVSAEQKNVHEALRALGWPCEVVTSAHQAFEIIRNLGAPWSGAEWPNG